MKTLLAAFAALLLSTAAFARPSEGERPDHPPPCGGPPQVTIDACESRKVDDACSFETPRGDDVEGTCKIVGEDEVLACVPADAPPPRPKR